MKTEEDRERALGPAATIARFESNDSTETANLRSLFDYADALRQVGRRKEALALYDSLNNRAIPEGRKWLLKVFHGQAFSDAGMHGDAEEAFRRAAELKPDSTVAWVFLAGTLAAQEKFEEAVQVLEQSLNLVGDPDEVLLNLGLNLRALGRLQEASERLLKALDLTPDYAEAREALADVSQAIQKERKKRGQS